jgi:hypothetical protein
MAPVNTHGKTQARSVERRSGNDRRLDENQPPGTWEPDVAELEITPSQWDLLHADALPVANGTRADGT